MHQIVPLEKISKKTLYFSTITTPLGPMRVVGDEESLYLLEFMDKKEGEKEWQRFIQQMGAPILAGRPGSIISVERELDLYFKKRLTLFKTPVTFFGTPFQLSVWEELKKIPWGETRSYAEISQTLGKPKGYRAVARANGANILAIIVPCHRVIYADGSLGGYAGGVERKKLLLSYEE